MFKKKISPYIVDLNNFNLIRLILALIVFLAHISELTNFKEISFLRDYLSSSFAIKSFFIISGFLIFMSYERSSSIKRYFINRFLRIYPAYCLIIIITAIAFYFVSAFNYIDYYTFDLLRYIIYNLFFLNFLEPTLPGVFAYNNINAVNGALWTLKIEVLFYLMVPFFVYLFNKYNHLVVIISTYIISILYTQSMLILYEFTNLDIYIILARQLPGQLIYFMVGAFIYYFYNYLYRKKTVLLFLVPALLLMLDDFITISSPRKLKVSESISIPGNLPEPSSFRYIGSTNLTSVPFTVNVNL